jgi:shikimate kinase
MVMNYVLIGMQGAGKSTIGRELALYQRCDFYDSDTLIKNQYELDTGDSLNVSEIYQQLGVVLFRQLESNIVARLSQMIDSVIATGGGTMMNINHVKQLKKNGVLIYLYQTKDQFLKRLPQPKSVPPADVDHQYSDWNDYYARRHAVFSQLADQTVELSYKNTAKDLLLLSTLIEVE